MLYCKLCYTRNIGLWFCAIMSLPAGVEPAAHFHGFDDTVNCHHVGGVATSGLEMSQNSMRLSWTRDEVEQRLHGIMKAIHKNCLEAAEAYGTPGDYLPGANIGGFLKVTNAMLAYGIV